MSRALTKNWWRLLKRNSLCINWHKYTKQRIAHNHGCYLRFNISWRVCVAVRKFVGFKVVSVLRDRNPRFQSGPAPSPSSPCSPHGWLSHPCHEMFANYSQTRLLIWETILMTRVLFGAPPWVMWGFWIRKLFGAPFRAVYHLGPSTIRGCLRFGAVYRLGLSTIRECLPL